MASDAMLPLVSHRGEVFEGVEALHMIRKGQVKRLDRSYAMGQARFVESLFGVAA